MTNRTFDPALAAERAARAIRERFAEVRDQAEAEMMAALAGAERYARHLAGGGDPREGFERPRGFRSGTEYVSGTVYLEQVYEEWNEARGSRNPFSPISHLQDYEIGEYGLAHVGEPVPFSTYRDDVASANVRRSVQSDTVARALAACQGDDLVLRRTKVGGKVAYLLRERQEGEEFVGRRSEISRINVSIFATNVPEERWNP